MAGFLSGPYGEAVRGAMFEGDPSQRSSVLLGPVIVGRVERVMDDAIARGELPHMPSPAVVNLGHAVAMSEFLHTGLPPSPDAITVLVDELWMPALENRQGEAEGATADSGAMKQMRVARARGGRGPLPTYCSATRLPSSGGRCRGRATRTTGPRSPVCCQSINW